MSPLHWLEYPSREGPGMPVLFLHGFMGTGEEWEPVTRALPEVRALCPDLPGHGQTRVPAAAHSMEQCVEMLVAGMDARKVSRCAVIGYSLGGRVALHLALQVPERVERLLLESSSPGIDDAAQRAARRVRDLEMADTLRALDTDAEGFRCFLDDWYEQPLFNSLKTRPDLRAALVEIRAKNRPAGLADSLAGMGAGAQESLWSRLVELHCPTLAMAGEFDPKFCQAAQTMTTHCAPMTVRILPECGHNVHLELPALFIHELRQFLGLSAPGKLGNAAS